MASNRTLIRVVARVSGYSIARSSVSSNKIAIQHASRPATAQRFPPRVLLAQRRWHSAPSEKEFKVYDFQKVKSLLENPSDNTMLIDVREPHEYAEGFIPTALNLPIQSQPDALFLPADEFQDRFGFVKPPVGKKIVFYCKAGVRSSAAAQLARQVGYEDVVEYRGSWLDWVKQGGASSLDARGKGEAGGAPV